MTQNTFVNKIVKIHYFLKKKKASKIIFVAQLKFCNNFFYTISTNKFFLKKIKYKWNWIKSCEENIL